MLFIMIWQTHTAITHEPSHINFSVYVSNSNAQDGKVHMTSLTSKKTESQEASLLSKLNELGTSLQKNINHAHQAIDKKRIFLGIGFITLSASYLYLWYILAHANTYFKNKNLWSNWQDSLSFEALLAIPQEEFARQLLTEIHRRYAQASAITDILGPITSFINAITEEEQHINQYISLLEWIEYTRVARLFPVERQTRPSLDGRLQRVAYFKNTVQTWAAHYALEQLPKHHIHTNIFKSAPAKTAIAKVWLQWNTDQN